MAENLEHLYGSEEIENAFSSMVCGRKTVITKRKCGCGYSVKGSEKFCPECGSKIKK